MQGWTIQSPRHLRQSHFQTGLNFHGALPILQTLSCTFISVQIHHVSVFIFCGDVALGEDPHVTAATSCTAHQAPYPRGYTLPESGKENWMLFVLWLIVFSNHCSNLDFAPGWKSSQRLVSTPAPLPSPRREWSAIIWPCYANIRVDPKYNLFHPIRTGLFKWTRFTWSNSTLPQPHHLPSNTNDVHFAIINSMSNLRTQHGSSEPQRSPTTSGRFAEAVNATAFFIQLCQFPKSHDQAVDLLDTDPLRLRQTLWGYSADPSYGYLSQQLAHDRFRLSSFGLNVSRRKHERLLSNICKGSITFRIYPALIRFVRLTTHPHRQRLDKAAESLTFNHHSGCNTTTQARFNSSQDPAYII